MPHFKFARKGDTGTTHVAPSTTVTSTVTLVPPSSERANWYALEPVRTPRLIHWLCTYSTYYEVVSITFLIMFVGLFPYNAFFNVKDPDTANFVFYTDVIFAIDIVIRLGVEIWRSTSQARFQVFMFPYRLEYCILDIISTAPLYYIPCYLYDEDVMTFSQLDEIQWYQVPSLCRMYRVFLFFGALEAQFLLYETIIFVLKFTLMYLGFILGVSVAYFWFTHLEELEYFLLTRNRVHHSIYLPGVCIVKEGDSGNSMYIVYRGQVSGLVAGNSPLAPKEPQLKEVYLFGDVFGKLPCLFQNESYKKPYRAESITEVLELQSKEVRHLAYIYPEFMQMLKAIIASKYNPQGESDSILSPQRARKKNLYDLGEDYQQGGAKAEAKQSKKQQQHMSHHEGGGEGHHAGQHAGPAPNVQFATSTAPKHDGAGPSASSQKLPPNAPIRSGIFTAVSQFKKKKKKMEHVEDVIHFLHSKNRLSLLKQKVKGKTKPGTSAASKPSALPPPKGLKKDTGGDIKKKEAVSTKSSKSSKPDTTKDAVGKSKQDSTKGKALPGILKKSGQDASKGKASPESVKEKKGSQAKKK